MASSQSASMISQTTLPSGISNLPKILPYPKLPDISVIKKLESTLVYIQDHPGNVGFTILIKRDADDVFLQAGFLNGVAMELDTDESDLANKTREFIQKYAVSIVKFMSVVKIEQAQYYIFYKNGEYILEDARIAANKFAGPGLIRDLFSTLISIPNIRKIEPLTSDMIEAISLNQGSYEGDLVIKPSRFRLYDEIVDDNIPFYVEVLR